LDRSGVLGFGVRILKTAWFNFDLAWALALIISGLATALL
jgi:hypothetical protein